MRQICTLTVGSTFALEPKYLKFIKIPLNFLFISFIMVVCSLSTSPLKKMIPTKLIVIMLKYTYRSKAQRRCSFVPNRR